MTRSTRKPHLSPARDALFELAVATPEPDAALLEELVRRHPEHAAELRQAAVDLALDAAKGRLEGEDEEPVDAEDPAVQKAMRRFRERRAELDAKAGAPAEAENPFLALDKERARALGQRLQASTLFVMKLRDRRIRPETMSDGFRRRVAEELSVPVELLAAHFAGKPTLPRAAYYKSDQPPQAGEQQTFEEAVKSSGLTPEQQAYLLGL
jgi:hypothetical protein